MHACPQLTFMVNNRIGVYNTPITQDAIYPNRSISQNLAARSNAGVWCYEGRWMRYG